MIVTEIESGALGVILKVTFDLTLRRRQTWHILSTHGNLAEQRQNVESKKTSCSQTDFFISNHFIKVEDSVFTHTKRAEKPGNMKHLMSYQMKEPNINWSVDGGMACPRWVAWIELRSDGNQMQNSLQNLQQKKTDCRLHSFLAECFLDLHETDSRVFWHSEISVEKTAKLDSGIKPESSMKSKPGDEVWE